jgi:Rrf2 family transcriptional regulator, nitric oxide-sensitive transcriptional repressor
MFSQTVEYALRTVVYLAGQEKPRTNPEISEATKVKGPYLAKVIQQLVKKGLIKSQRGLHGGCTLAKSPEEVTIWEVVDAVEPIQRIKMCPLELESHKTKLCPLHKRIDDALAQIEKAFKDTTMADILAEPTTSKPLCPFPHVEENGRFPLN